jgi:hypothetical protein
MLLLSILALTACTLFSSLKSQRSEALNEFIYALRWQRYPEAAGFFIGEPRQDFLDRMEKIEKDLTITDVRLQRLDLLEDGRRAAVRLEMDYFLLPSATLKTLRIDQTWVYFEAGDGVERDGFRITTPFPKIPGETLPAKGTLPP